MSKFQPDRTGKHPQVPVHPGMTVAHTSSREHVGEHNNAHATLGKAPKFKGQAVVPVHGGMHHVTNGKPVTGGGSNRSALDAVSGAIVPAGRTAAQPGWGNGTVRSGNPMVHPPGSKQLTRVAVHPSMSRGADHDKQLAELGAAVLRSAVENK